MATPLSMLAGGTGGGMSTSATATSGGTASTGDGGDGMFGDFNFKNQSASGAATVGGVSPWLVLGGVILTGAVLWYVLRKQSRA